MNWETVVGLETHVQLSTRSKIFSSASTAFGAAPNTQACAVDIALPGVLPVLNRAAVEKAIKFGVAIGATINRRSVFARKNYFYPDLPKGYQISQYELPIVQGGQLQIVVGDAEKTVRLTRAHLEEDAGKSLHENFQDMSGIDLNRAGTPLLEIVSEPDMRSAEEAVAYAKALHTLVRWIDICDGNMQEGSFRCDANVSVRTAGSVKLGTRCEIKNLNSFRFLERAIEFEARRQIEILEDGGAIEQETRLYDPDKDETRSMRTKEDAHDYRYFPDPDLLPLEISTEWIDKVARDIPEQQDAMRMRFVHEYQIKDDEANLLTATKATAEYFEDSTRRLLELNPAEWSEGGTGPTDARWMYGGAIARGVIGLLAAQLNREGLEIDQSRVTAGQFAVLHARMIDNTLSAKSAREVFQALWEAGTQSEDTVDAVIEAKGLRQISDAGTVEKIVDDVIAANPAQVADYRAGKEKAFNFLVGQAMKATKGKANPAQLTEILKRKLAD
ncbi:MAG TPA: Asp-tRNA(Asn)/Glu-tRNA(Gln) amidotransferase subunit GatB [Burkholderiales bacterium]|nr:Asp-tRNA(Asn)/Glu-tRNA(Gln) amidotransferase subunit GatB [Burkholderiales bacterium]